jgi:hypothetical protein
MGRPVVMRRMGRPDFDELQAGLAGQRLVLLIGEQNDAVPGMLER